MSHYTFPADHDESGHVAFPPVPSGKFLKDDGTWADGGASFPVGVVVLTEGNTNPSTLGIPGTWEEY